MHFQNSSEIFFFVSSQKISENSLKKFFFSFPIQVFCWNIEKLKIGIQPRIRVMRIVKFKIIWIFQRVWQLGEIVFDLETHFDGGFVDRRLQQPKNRLQHRIALSLNFRRNNWTEVSEMMQRNLVDMLVEDPTVQICISENVLLIQLTNQDD